MVVADGGSCRVGESGLSIYRLAIDCTLNVHANGVVQLCSSGDDADAFADGVVAVVHFLTSGAVLEDAMRCLDTRAQYTPWSTRMISGVTPNDVSMGV